MDRTGRRSVFGGVRAEPDYSRIRGGVTSRAKTAREAVDANSKLVSGITSALTSSGIEQKDIQTVHFSIQPIYTSSSPNTEQKLTGFTASNQVTVTLRHLDKVGEILDRLIAAGATDVRNVEFLHADLSKTLDRARELAMADARRKAELYARSSSLTLGGVVWIAEDASRTVPIANGVERAVALAPVPDLGRRRHVTCTDNRRLRHHTLKPHENQLGFCLGLNTSGRTSTESYRPNTISSETRFRVV